MFSGQQGKVEPANNVWLPLLLSRLGGMIWADERMEMGPSRVRYDCWLELMEQKVCNLMNNKKAINLSVTVIISEDVNSESRAARLGSTRLT